MKITLLILMTLFFFLSWAHAIFLIPLLVVGLIYGSLYES